MTYHLKDYIRYADEYFSKGIDYEETGDKNLIPLPQFDAVQEILSMEASIFTLRRTPGGGDYLDTVSEIRVKLISEYEEKYKEDFIVDERFSL